MDYKDAIAYLKENDIRKEDGTFYEFGEVSIEDVMTLDIHVHVDVGISLRDFLSNQKCSVTPYCDVIVTCYRRTSLKRPSAR